MFILLSVSISSGIYATDFSVRTRSSELREATARTVEDDVYTLMNVNDWKKTQFNSFIAFTSIDSNSSGNAAVGLHLDSNVLAFRWKGNLWSDSSTNSFTGFLGWNNLGFKLTISEAHSDTHSIITTSVNDYSLFGISAEFGMPINDKLYFDTDLDFSIEKGNTSPNTTLSLTEFILFGDIFYILKDTENFTAKIHGGYTGYFDTTKYLNNDTTENLNVLFTGAKLQYKPIEQFIYGLNAETQISFGDDIFEWDIFIRNGFSLALKPDVLFLNAGIETSLPYILSVNGTTTKGTFNTDFYLGLSYAPVQNIRIDACADITNITGGVSVDDMINEKFSLSLVVKQ